MGSPPIEQGAQSFVVVTNANNHDEHRDIYYEDWVGVGSSYVLDHGELLEEGFWIRIYDSDDRLDLTPGGCIPVEPLLRSVGDDDSFRCISGGWLH